MDNLARNAMLAKQANMSYGKWKAMQKPVPIVMVIPEGHKKCVGCGSTFLPNHKSQKYCGIDCQRRTQQRKHRERQRAYRLRKGDGA